MVPVEISHYPLTMCPEWITFNELYLIIQRQYLGREGVEIVCNISIFWHILLAADKVALIEF